MLNFLKSNIVLKKHQWSTVFVIALLWHALFTQRNATIHLKCLQKSCKPSDIFFDFDRISLGFLYRNADLYSDLIQNFILFFCLILLVYFYKSNQKKVYPEIFLNVGVFFETMVLNGLLTELTKQFFQRPRPLVYLDNKYIYYKSLYTSFYSGHTSYVAATVSCFLIILNRKNIFFPKKAVYFFSFLMIAIVGTLRVLAGKHFPSDVFFGAFMGLVVAILVHYRHS